MTKITNIEENVTLTILLCLKRLIGTVRPLPIVTSSQTCFLHLSVDHNFSLIETSFPIIVSVVPFLPLVTRTQFRSLFLNQLRLLNETTNRPCPTVFVPFVPFLWVLSF